MVRLIIFAIVFSFGCLNTSGQDLGSSNKLFAGASKKTTITKSAKKRTSSTPKKPVSGPSGATTPKSAKSVPSAKEKAASKSTPKKSVSITKSSAAKVDTPKKEKASESSAPIPKKSLQVEKRPPGVPTVSGNALSGSPPSVIVDPIKTAEQFEDQILAGNTYRDERDYAAAEVAYTKAKSLKPTDARAVYGLGNLYSDQLRWQEAEKHYRQAIAMSPNDSVAHIALSYVLVQPVAASNLADRYEEAEKLARRGIDLAPANSLAYDQLGVSLEMRGFIGIETENAYRKAIQLDPAFAPPHAHLGRLLRRRGKSKDASAAYQNAVDRSRDVGTKILVAEVLQSEQRFADSEALLRAALKEDPRNPTALLLLAGALITTSNFGEAETVLRKAISIGTNGFLANSQLASIYLRQAKLELAENALLQAARFVSELDRRSLSRSYEAVGDAYMKSGNNRSAERAFKQAITFDSETDILSGKLSRAQQGRFSPGN